MREEREEELEQRLSTAQGELDAARAEVVGVEAQIAQLENEAQTARTIGDRSIADVERAIKDSEIRDDYGGVRDNQEKAARERKQLTEKLNQIESRLGVLRNRKIEANARQTERELEVKDLKERWAAFADSNLAFEEQIQQAEELQGRLAALEAERDELASRIDEYATVIEGQREAVGESVAEGLADDYSKRADEHVGDWRRWLRWLVAFGVLALVGGVGVILTMHPDSDATNAEIASSIAVDLLVLGLLLYAVRFAARQFSVHRHLAAVAQTKVDALLTFKRVIAEQRESEVRSAISAVLAQAGFDSGVTGFVEGSDDSITLIERVVAPVAQKASG